MMGYKWLSRWAGRRSGAGGSLASPHASPRADAAAMEARMVAVRDAHPAWGARKIAHCLERDGHGCRRRRRPCIRSCAGTGGSSRREEAPPSQASASRRQRPICCGRWTSRAGCRLADGSALSSADGAGRSFALCPVPEGLRRTSSAPRCRSGWSGRSAATACRRLSSSTTAHLGAIPSGARWTRLRVWLLKLGISGGAQPGPTTRRAAARTSASIAR